MLIEKHDDIKKLEQLKFLSDAAEIARTSPMLMPKSGKDGLMSSAVRENTHAAKNVSWADLVSVLNGFGRIVEYKDNGEEVVLDTVREGVFKNGMLDEYGRHYDLRDESSAHLNIGFFTEGQLDGKGERYYLGYPQEPETGIWEHGELKKQLPVKNFESRTITNSTTSALEEIKKRGLDHSVVRQDDHVMKKKLKDQFEV